MAIATVVVEAAEEEEAETADEESNRDGQTPHNYKFNPSLSVMRARP
jgi:hypothetical protein